MKAIRYLIIVIGIGYVFSSVAISKMHDAILLRLWQNRFLSSDLSPELFEVYLDFINSAENLDECFLGVNPHVKYLIDSKKEREAREDEAIEKFLSALTIDSLKPLKLGEAKDYHWLLADDMLDQYKKTRLMLPLQKRLGLIDKFSKKWGDLIETYQQRKK